MLAEGHLTRGRVRFDVAADHDAAAFGELTVGEVVETEFLTVKAEEAVSKKATLNNLDYAAKPRRGRIAQFSSADTALALQIRP
jgi:hypothetical protein